MKDAGEDLLHASVIPCAHQATPLEAGLGGLMAADEVDRDFPKQRTVRHHSLGKMRNRNVCCLLEIAVTGRLRNRRCFARVAAIDCKWYRSKPLELRGGSHKVADETRYRCRVLEVRRMTGARDYMDPRPGKALRELVRVY